MITRRVRAGLAQAGAGLVFVMVGDSARAARAIQGSVGEVTQADATALGTVGFRIWSGLAGGETNVNDNTSSCRNVRCMRSFIVNSTLAFPGAPGGGGYVGNQEATQVYNSDAQPQPFYELADASMNPGAGNHIGYFGVAGVTADNSGVGSFLAQDCGASGAQNCFGRLDLDDAGPPLTNTARGYGGPPNTIRPIGGLNPIPNVRINGISFGFAHLSWNDPPTYAGTMRPGTLAPAPPSPVLGVRLWKNDTFDHCTAPSDDDPAWTSIGAFPLGENTHFDPLFLAPYRCRFYALTVRLVGPGGLPNEIETFRIGVNSQAVGADPTLVRVRDFGVRYVGHGVVSVLWQSGFEGDVEGFYVTRGPTAEGPFSRVSERVPPTGDGSAYAVTDTVGPGGARTLHYRLEILDRNGTMTTSATASVTIPGRRRRSVPAIR